ncbi:putative ribonuclease H-like domain-containing protein [Tanacetum coccineum]
MVPKALLMRSSLVSLTTARPVNTAQPRTTVNSARPMTNVLNKAHLTVRRPNNNITATKNSNFNQMVNIVKHKNVNTAKPKAVVNTARPKAVLNAVKGNQGNPQQDLEKKGVIDSGCLRHMTGNMSYLTDFKEIDRGYVAFGGNPKGRKITGRGTKACDDAGDGEKKVTKEPGKEGGDPRKDSEFNDQEKEDYDDEDVGAEADMNNLDTFMPVSPIPTTRIHKDHPDEQIIKDLNSSSQTRRMTKILEEHARIEAIRLFLAYASFKDFMVYQMDVNSAFLYGKIKEEVYVCQPPGFEDPDFPDRVYKVEKELYGLHQASRPWYETLSTYLLDNGFQRGQIDKTLFIRRDKGDILLVQMSSMGELTFFLGLQVKQKEDGIFISQDKYVTGILKKFGFTDVKTASTPMETQRYLKGQPKLGLWYPKDSPFDLVAYTDMQKQTVVANSTTKLSMWLLQVAVDKFFGFKINYLIMDLLTKAFDASFTTAGLLLLMKVNAVRHNLLLPVQVNAVEGTATAKVKTVNEEGQIQALLDGKKVVITESTIRRDLHLEDAEGTDCLPNATFFEELTRMGVLDLEQTKTTQALEIESLKRRVKKLEKKQRSRTYKLKRLFKDIDANEDTALDSPHFDTDPDMFGVHDLDGDEVFVETEELEVNAATTTSTIPVSAAKDLSDVDMTLAQALVELKTAKPKAVTTAATTTTTAVTRPKAKGLVIQEHEQASTPKASTPITSSKDKAIRLQAQFDEEDRIAREKEEVNAALIAQWNDIQDKVETDYELAQMLQAEE